MFTIITRNEPPCAYCKKTKELLNSLEIPYKEHFIDDNALVKQVLDILGYKTVPIIIDGAGKVLGGYDDLVLLLKSDEVVIDNTFTI